MSAIGYYPGCSLGGSAAEYDLSVRAVAQKLGVTLQEVPAWVCCGASSGHAIDRSLATSLAADTLAKARHAGMDRILAPCAMCYQRLASTAHEMKQHAGMAAELAEALGEKSDLGLDRVKPLSLLNWLSEMPDDAITSLVTRPLAGLKVACYYGCLLLRPASVTGEANVEAPRSMERIIKLLGGEPVRWTMTTECCGGSFSLSRKTTVIRQCAKIFKAARSAGADVMGLACPMCHANLDMRQGEYAKGESPMPMVYLTQLMGWAFGVEPAQLGLGKHFVPAEGALAASCPK